MNTSERIDPISGFWSRLGTKRRLGLIAGILFIALLMAVLLSGVLSEEYGVLFSDLEYQDAAVVTKRLDRLKIEYHLADDGKTIKIAKNSVHRTRLKLMENGVVINSGVGFELFDKDNFGATEYAQKINYQRALQGELERTIQSFHNVKRVRVHLVLKQKSLFKRKTNGATASVTVTLKRNNHLNSRQVVGIQNLISAAVPGLIAMKVTVLNNNGITLSHNTPYQSSQMVVNDGLAKTKMVERYLSGKAQKILNSIYGMEQASVSVNVELSLDYIRKKRESYSPVQNAQGGIKRKTTNDHEMTKRKGTMNSRRSSNIEYLWDKTIEQIAVAPGAIKRLSVAIVVPAGKNENSYTNMQAVVARAVGLNKSRGDKIVFYSKEINAQRSMQGYDSSVAKSPPGIPAKMHRGTKSSGPAPATQIASVGKSTNFNVNRSSKRDDSGLVQRTMSSMASWIAHNPQITLFVIIFVSSLVFILVWRAFSLRTYRVIIAPTDNDASENIQKEKVLVDIQDWINKQTEHKKAS